MANAQASKTKAGRQSVKVQAIAFGGKSKPAYMNLRAGHISDSAASGWLVSHVLGFCREMPSACRTITGWSRSTVQYRTPSRARVTRDVTFPFTSMLEQMQFTAASELQAEGKMDKAKGAIHSAVGGAKDAVKTPK
jgi:hypothetical protein